MEVNPCYVNWLSKWAYIVCVHLGIFSFYFCLKRGLNRVLKGSRTPGGTSLPFFDGKCFRRGSGRGGGVAGGGGSRVGLADSICMLTQGILYIEISHLRKAGPIHFYKILNKDKNSHQKTWQIPRPHRKWPSFFNLGHQRCNFIKGYTCLTLQRGITPQLWIRHRTLKP